MPLIKDESGAFVGSRCINQCGELSELEDRASILINDDEQPHPVTVLFCPECQYLELYYGDE